MAAKSSKRPVAKLLTYVFDDEALLPSVRRWQLADGMFIAPLSAFLLEQDSDYHVIAVEPHFSQFFRDYLHETTLNIEYQGDGRLNYEGVKSQEHSSADKLNRYLLASMLHNPAFVVPYAFFVTIPAEKRICHSSRMREFGPLRSATSAALTKADFHSIDNIYTAVTAALGDTSPGRLPLALRSYQQAFRTDIDLSLRLVGMMSAVEALMLSAKTELAHQVSERVAFFLADAPEDREATYKDMKRLYNTRSAVSHGSMPKKVKRTINDDFVRLLEFLRGCLLKILGDQDLLVFFRTSGSDRFDDGMRHMLFHGEIAT